MLFKSKKHASEAAFENASTNELLHVYYDGHRLKGLQVLDASKTTPVYNIDIKWHILKMPKLAIYSTATGNLLASVDYSMIKKRISMNYGGQAINLNAPGFWGLDYKYPSPTLNGREMTWQHKKKLDELNMVLLDDQAMPLARFIPTTWAMKKGGKIELLNSRVSGPQGGALRDEIVVTAIAVMVYRHIQRQYAATSSAASSSSAAAASS